ncbi:Protein SKIP34 [Striga hermonthica]|uniref:Protein SKIP34 n=1 Tax=Striga hermonthica TaxID=68872 RepID=A0A9N7NG88_STRHE|nr:Protein SKIP34 [Striga hermonthica]
MCYGRERLPSKEDIAGAPRAPRDNEDSVENLMDRLAETEARLERARAREAELSRRLDETRKFVCVMKILDSYLRRQNEELRERVARYTPDRRLSFWYLLSNSQLYFRVLLVLVFVRIMRQLL